MIVLKATLFEGSQLSVGVQGGDDEVTPGYKAPKKVDLQTIQQMDQDDEALVKYKQELLGKQEDVKGNLIQYVFL